MDKRRDLLLNDESHDPMKPTRKLVEPTVCPQFDATCRVGRWMWERDPSDAPRSLCSTCQRIDDDYAAGFVTIRGKIATDHLDVVTSLVRNSEEREKQTRSIERIMLGRRS